MCGRFGLTRSPAKIAEKLGATYDEAGFQPHYNVAPTQPILAALNGDERTVAALRWGLVPWWSEGPKSMKLSTFNARIETIATSRVYREALEKRRCAIFADGYFEWHKEPDGSKTPVWIYRKDEQPFVFPVFGRRGARMTASSGSGAVRSSRSRQTSSLSVFIRGCPSCWTSTRRGRGSSRGRASRPRCLRSSRRLPRRSERHTTLIAG